MIPELITDEFLSERPLSASSLKAFRKSPRHYRLYLEKKFIPSDAQVLGSVVDVLALTPEMFDKKFFVSGDINKRTKAGKEEWAKLMFEASEKGITVITKEQYEKARLMVEALYSYDQSAALLNAKKNQQRKLQWIYKPAKLPMVGYLDFEARVWENDWIVDLKTTKDADPEKFMRDAANYDYEIQAATYTDYFHRKLYKYPDFIFLAVESSEPYNVSVNFCDNKYMESAKKELYGTLHAFRYCMENFPDFNVGYEFRLMETGNYFSLEIPRYKKSIFGNFA